MKRKRIGYARISRYDGGSESRLEQANVSKIYTDNDGSGDSKRPQLEALLSDVRSGDTVVVQSMDRLATSLNHLNRLMLLLVHGGVGIEFMQEGLVFGADNPMSLIMMSFFSGIIEFERICTRERQLEGIELAKQRGVYQGRKKLLTGAQVQILRERAAAGESKTRLANDLNISRETVYQYLREQRS